MSNVPASRPSPAVDDLRRVEQAGALVMAARIALRRGQVEAARAKLKEAFALSPTDCGALELLGDVFLEEGEQEKAIKVFERGLQFHPRHRAFEEKIALAYLDLDEMKRDALRREMVLELGDTDRLLDCKPGAAFGLSLMVPGAGQVYYGDNVRAAIFAGTAIFLFLMWIVPLSGGIGALPEGARKGFGALGQVLSNWPGWGRTLFWLMFLSWCGTHLLAAFDGLSGANRANEDRRRGLGIAV